MNIFTHQSLRTTCLVVLALAGHLLALTACGRSTPTPAPESEIEAESALPGDPAQVEEPGEISAAFTPLPSKTFTPTEESATETSTKTPPKETAAPSGQVRETVP